MNDIIYVDLECLLIKYDTCSDDPNKSHTRNVAYHTASAYALSTFRNHDNSTEVSYYRGEDCIQQLCIELRFIGNEMFETEVVPMAP